MTTETIAKCRHSQVAMPCPTLPSRENCRECLYVQVDKANGGDGVCDICGADRANYLAEMREPCWHGHGVCGIERE